MRTELRHSGPHSESKMTAIHQEFASFCSKKDHTTVNGVRYNSEKGDLAVGSKLVVMVPLEDRYRHRMVRRIFIRGSPMMDG